MLEAIVKNAAKEANKAPFESKGDSATGFAAPIPHISDAPSAMHLVQIAFCIRGNFRLDFHDVRY